MITKQDVVRKILRGRTAGCAAGLGEAFAPANIALCKYWGKRNAELNLPVTSSLSISLGSLGSRIRLKPSESADTFALNGEALDPQTSFCKRAGAFLDLFRPAPDYHFSLDAQNTVPTAAGFASSASGFAALVLALDRFFGWGLGEKELTILARLGSGSAARSIVPGFVMWSAGKRADGMDSFAEPLDAQWPDLRMGLLVLSAEEKSVGSRPAMIRTVETSDLYKAWPGKVARDLMQLETAIHARDFHRLGQTAESNALAMHATMISAWPPIVYWQPESMAAMHEIWRLREAGLALYFTMDAGPNIKLIFQPADEQAVREAFPSVQVVAPFEEI